MPAPLDGVARTKGDSSQDAAYSSLVDAYEATADWGRAVRDRLFPDGWVRKVSKPTNMAGNFKYYTWGRIYPRGGYHMKPLLVARAQSASDHRVSQSTVMGRVGSCSTADFLLGMPDCVSVHRRLLRHPL